MSDHDATTTHLLGFDEAARRLALSKRTIERLAAQGAVRVIRIGRRRLIEVDELRRFIEKSRQ